MEIDEEAWREDGSGGAFTGRSHNGAGPRPLHAMGTGAGTLLETHRPARSRNAFTAIHEKIAARIVIPRGRRFEREDAFCRRID